MNPSLSQVTASAPMAVIPDPGNGGEAGNCFDRASDIHIELLPSPPGHNSAPRLGCCLFFPGPHDLSCPDDRLRVQALLPQLLSQHAEDFMLEADQAVFRVQRSSQAIGGTWFRLRRVLRDRPTLQTLPSRLGSAVEAALLCPSLSGGGLVLVLGAPGSGKTTTASAVVASRLQHFGGYGYTVEDPPEIMGLSGRHGAHGFCVQHQVFDTHDGWERSIKQVLRGQPLGSPLILLVGEIRTPEAARMIVRAASNGFLVVTTSFAFDMVSGIDALLQLAGTEHAASLSHVFRVAVFQTLLPGRPPLVRAQHLSSQAGSSRVAVAIRCGRLSMLRDELVMTAARHMH